MEISQNRLPIGGFARLVPELQVFDLEQSKAFWCGTLGFKIAYQRSENRFMFIELEGSQVMLKQRNGKWGTGVLERPLGRGINFQMFVDSLTPLAEALRRALGRCSGTVTMLGMTLQAKSEATGNYWYKTLTATCCVLRKIWAGDDDRQPPRRCRLWVTSRPSAAV